MQGRYFDFLGHIFSVYCVWKIFISTVNIIFDRVGKVDPVTRGIEITVKYIGLELDVKFWSQQFSFLLIGILIVTSIRGLLITMTKFFNSIASAKSSNIIVLALAEIMGMYFVSSVLLMRMNMPEKYRLIITQVLGELQFSFYHRWFDLIFLISALSSIGFLSLAHKQAPEKHMYDNYSWSTWSFWSEILKREDVATLVTAKANVSRAFGMRLWNKIMVFGSVISQSDITLNWLVMNKLEMKYPWSGST